MPPVTETERDLQRLASALKELEAEYTMFFAGRLPRPPWESRSRVQAMIRQFDRSYIQNVGDRFRFQTLQARFAKFSELWDRSLRAREEGRPSPLGRSAPAATHPVPRTPEGGKPADRVVRVASFRDPAQETDKLRELYDSLLEARREIGAQPVSYLRFADLVQKQIRRLQGEGVGEVAFRVAVKEGRVDFTARAIKSEP